MLEFLAGQLSQFAVIQKVNEGRDVVATLHHAQQLNSFLFIDQRRSGFAFDNGGQESGLHVGGFVHTRRNAVFQEVDQSFFLTGRRVLQQLNQSGSLLGVQGLGRNTQGFTFGNVFTVGF